MAKEYARRFYNSKQWKDCKNNYLKSVNGLCERCKNKGIIQTADIVHHKIYISEKNINNEAITLNFNNLEALCQDCHNKEHVSKAKRYKVDKEGRVTLI